MTKKKYQNQNRILPGGSRAPGIIGPSSRVLLKPGAGLQANKHMFCT